MNFRQNYDKLKFFKYRSNGRVVDVLAFWQKGTEKLTKVTIDSPSMQPCTVCVGARCGDGSANLFQLIGTKTSIMKI